MVQAAAIEGIRSFGPLTSFSLVLELDRMGNKLGPSWEQARNKSFLAIISLLLGKIFLAAPLLPIGLDGVLSKEIIKDARSVRPADREAFHDLFGSGSLFALF
jgi:hypothetical protein